MSSDGEVLRVDQVGSLIRPPALEKLWEEAAGTDVFGDDDLQSCAADSVRELLEEQLRRGIAPVTDGEYWRRNFQDVFPLSVSGYEPGGDSFTTDPARDNTGELVPETAYARRLRADSRLTLANNHLLREFEADLAAAGDLDVRDRMKLTLIGPERIAQRCDQQASAAVYGTRQELLDDIVAIEAQMLEQVLSAGCRYVQIDEPSFTAYVDQRSLDAMRAKGEDPDQLFDMAIAANNALVDAVEAAGGATTGLHMCRGNGGSAWHREGPYDAIAEKAFSSLRHKRLLLEYDTARAGGFEPLRFLAKGTIAVLGLVSTKTGVMETRDDLMRRIEEASRFAPIEQLAISPQCGFATTGTGRARALDVETQWKKLELVKSVAEEVW